MDRMYSVLTVKAVEDDKRVITGTATTPVVDRVGDIIEPLGVKFTNPLPLLHQHDSDRPVGTVTFDKPTKDGITFEARLPKIEEPGPLKDRVDTAWGEIKSGLIRAVSIGFRAIEYAFLQGGGVHFLVTEVMELSLVSVPANSDAKISIIKSIDAPLLAASGKEPKAGDRPSRPGVTGKSPKPVNLRPKEAKTMKTLAEQITALEAKRAAHTARMEEIQSAASEAGRTKEVSEKEEFDTLADEVDTIDGELKDLRRMEKTKAASAVPVTKIEKADDGAAARGGVINVSGPKLPPGIAFTRLARVRAVAKIDGESPRQLAKEWYGEDSQVYRYLVKAAVPAGNTGDSTWAGALVGDETSMFADFVEFLRPMTILGKFGANGVPSLRRVPFRTALIGQTTGGAGYWVGEGAAKPLTKFDFTRTRLEPLKVANIAVCTMEVLRDSSPSAEAIVRDQLAAALRERLDIDFIDPAKTAAAGVSPASITNGATPITASGTGTADDVRADIRAIFGAFIAANNAPTSGVWIMPATTALALSLMQNPLGQAEFPGINMNGGSLFGLPVIVSEYVPTVSAGANVVLVNAQDIYLADEGGINVDMSREASLEMDTTPSHTSTSPPESQLVSLWQTNSVGFLAERTINWAARRAEAVQVLENVNWGAPAGSPA
jgi:HK97 family phage major capsid protein/HK97 family phage prohead protease